MFRFTTVPLADVGAFGEGEVFRPRSGLTVVTGDSTGARMVAQACRTLYAQARSDAAPPWMVFLDSGDAPPYGGHPWQPLAPLLARLRHAGVPVDLFEREAEGHLRQLLRLKVGQPRTKFSYLDHVDQVKLFVQEEGCIRLVASNLDEDMSDDFHAMGERVVLALALNRAARRLLGIDEPLVAESWLDWLDGHLLQPCWECAAGMAPQVIILADAATLSHLGVDPHVQIHRDPTTGKMSLLALAEQASPAARPPGHPS